MRNKEFNTFLSVLPKSWMNVEICTKFAFCNLLLFWINTLHECLRRGTVIELKVLLLDVQKYRIVASFICAKLCMPMKYFIVMKCCSYQCSHRVADPDTRPTPARPETQLG